MRHVLPALLQSMAACWTSSRSINRGFAGYRRRILRHGKDASRPPSISWHNHNVIMGGTTSCFVPLLVDSSIHAHQRQYRRKSHPSSCYSHWPSTVGAVHRNPTRPTRVRFFSSNEDDDPTAPAPAAPDLWTKDLRACWQATSFTANPHSDPAMDGILQGLVSPAPQSLFVLERAIQNATPSSTSTSFSSFGGQDETTQTTRRRILGPALAPFTYLLKQGHHFSVPSVAVANAQHNNSSVIVAGVDWTIRPIIAPHDDANVDTDKNNNNNNNGLWEPLFDSSQQKQQHLGCRALAEHLLDYFQTESHAQRPIDESVVTAHVDQLHRRLQQTLGTDVRGRTAADTLFCLAVAGVTRGSLYDQL